MQALFTDMGGLQERRLPVARIELDGEPGEEHVNVGTAFAADGSPLGGFAWRPHYPEHAAHGGLFLC